MNIVFLLLLSLPVPFIAFIFQSHPRFLNRKFGVDIWTHLLYLKEYYKQGGIPKKIKNGFLVPGYYDYPPAFILILSRFPFKLVEKYEFLFSPFFDAVHQILIYFISYFLTSNIYIALVTQILYTLTPIIILENSSATPRSIGYTLFTLVFISLFIFETKGEVVFLLPAIFFGTLIFLSHRFTTQGFLFFSIFFSVLTASALYVSVFFLSFLLAIVFSRGFYLKVLMGHLGNLKFWQNNILYRFAHQVKGNYSQYKTRDFVFRLYNEFLKFPPFVLTITNPWTLPPLFMIIFLFPSNAFEDRVTLWVLFSYILALLTLWVPKLRFLGEGQRYLELSAFPSAYLSAKILFYFWQTNLRLPVIIFYTSVGIAALITTLVIQRKGIIKDTLRTVTGSMEKMFNYLKNLKVKPKLLCIPHQITTSTVYHTGCPVFVNANYTTIERISDVYPYLKKPIHAIMSEYGLDMILLNQDYARISDLKIKKYKIIKQFSNYILLKVEYL